MASVFGSSATRSSGSLFGASPTTASPQSALIDQLLRQAPTQPREDEGGGGLTGFLGNLVGGVVGLGQGVAALGGSAIHDVGQAVGLVDDKSGYRVDDVLKGLAGISKEGSVFNPADWHPMEETALIGDIANRYSPLLPGGEPASKSFQSFYDNPVPFLLDAAAVASAGAGAATKIGRASLTGTKGAEVAETALKSLAGEVAPRTARAASIRQGLEAIGKGDSLTARLLPKVRPKILEGGQFIPSAEAYNPLYRAALAPLKRYGLTQSVEDLRAGVAAAKTGATDVPTALRTVGDVPVMEDILRKADAAELKRIEKPGIRRLQTKYRSGKLLAEMKGRAYTARDAEVRKRLQTLTRYVDEDPSILERGAVELQDLHVGVGDVTPEGSLIPRQPEMFAVRDKLTGIGPTVRMGEAPADIAGTGAGATTLTRLGPVTDEVRTAVPELARRTDAAVQKIRDFIDKTETNRTAMVERGWTPARVDAEVEGAERLIAGLEDGLTRLGRHRNAADPYVEDDALVRYADEARLEEVEDFADTFGQATAMTPNDILDRAYRPLRAKYGLDYDFDNDTYEGGPGTFELDDAIRREGIHQPVYFAHMDATKLNASDYFTSRKKTGANIYAADPSNKQMKLVLLKRGTWSKDLVEVGKRRGARHIRETETFNVWDKTIREFGRPISDPRQVPDGFSLVAPDMLFINHKTRITLLDEIDKGLTKGLDPDSAMAGAMKRTIDQNYDDVAALQKAADVKMYAVPDVVLNRLDEAAKWSPAFGGKNARLFMDTPMNVWRGLTLTASPRWIVNNVLGNVAFQFMQGAKTADVLRIGGEKFRVLMHNWLRRRQGLPEIVGPRERSLAAGVQKLQDIGDVQVGHGYIGTYAEEPTKNLGKAASETAMGKAIVATREMRPIRATKRWGDAVKSLNSLFEDSWREAGFLAGIEKGQGINAIRRTGRSLWDSKSRTEQIMKGGFDPDQAKLALDEVNRFFGNYGSMTPFERHVIRRWIFPFWGFYRHTSKLLLTFPFEYPAKAQLLNSIANVNKDMMDQYGPLPDWLESAIPLGPPGTDAFLTTRGANPFSGVQEGIAGVASMLGPVPQTFFEQATGRDIFTGQEFSDRDVVTPFGSDQSYRIIYDDEGNPIGSEPVEKTAPGVIQGLLSNIPQYSMARDVIAGGRSYDTASVLDAIQQRFGDVGEATPIDPETGQPYSPVDAVSALTKFSGLPTTQYDLASFQERMTEDQRAVLLEALRRAGLAPTG